MTNILKTDKQNVDLRENGFAIVPFLDNSEIKALVDAFNALHPTRPSGFYASAHVPDPAFRKKASNLIRETLEQPLQRSFINCNPLGGAFLSKAPGEKSVLHLHQDWNIVDETLTDSYNLWIPLQDVNEQNGAVRVLPGSHNKIRTYRGPNLNGLLHNIAALAEAQMVSLNMRSGEALLYHHALWHSSPPNRSSTDRLAVVYGIIPQGAELKFYHRNNDSVEEYTSYPDFFFDRNPHDGPAGLSLCRVIEYNLAALEPAQFIKLFPVKQKTDHGRPQQHGFFSRLRTNGLASLFKHK